MELDWKSPERWADPDLARAIPKYWGRFNLYRDLCRAVKKGYLSGTFEELELVANGDVIIPRVGDTKRIALRKLLNSLEKKGYKMTQQKMELIQDMLVQTVERLESKMIPGLIVLPGTTGKALVREIERDGQVSLRMFVRFPGLPIDFSLPVRNRHIRVLKAADMVTMDLLVNWPNRQVFEQAGYRAA